MKRSFSKLIVIIVLLFHFTFLGMADNEIPIRKVEDGAIIKPKTVAPFLVYYNSDLNTLEIYFRQYTGILFFTVINIETNNSITGSISVESNNYITLDGYHRSYALILELENGEIYQGYFNT